VTEIASPLSADERSVLAVLLNDTSIRARRRARIVLDSADGKEDKSIALALNTRTSRVWRVRSAFQERRLDIFSPAAIKRAEKSLGRAADDVHSDMPRTMREAAHRTLAKQFAKLEQVETDVRKAEDPEAVHDMRVACRRLNSAFRLFRPYLPKKPVKKLGVVLEQLRDLLGEARNLDVLLHDLLRWSESLGAEDTLLDALVADWKKQRADLQSELVALLDSPAYQVWKMDLEAFLARVTSGSSPNISNVLPALVWRQYGTVRTYQEQLDEATLEELHALRIDIKRLRYTLEFFRDSLDARPDGKRTEYLIEPLVALQDHLGQVQDAVVAGEALTDFISAQAKAAKRAGVSVPEFQSVAGYHSVLQARIADLRMSLAAKWNVIVADPFRRRLALAVASL
jgi:CHAD domain-containing protein